MPKPGYTTIVVTEDICSHLEAIARTEGFRAVSQPVPRWPAQVSPNYWRGIPKG